MAWEAAPQMGYSTAAMAISDRGGAARSAAAFYPFYLSQHHALEPPAALHRHQGHCFFERNRPATFSHPIYSLLCDFRMYWDLWRGQLSA